ncbi:MAG TPA: LEA type 2 family protein [Gallionellaceae bacterium]
MFNQHRLNTTAYARNMGSASLLALFGLWLLLATGCSTLKPNLEKPAVNVTSFKLLSTQGFTPKFEIGLHVANPNSVQLSLKGMSYKLFLNEHEVMQGVANDLPVVPAYGEAELKLIANVGLMEGMRFVNEMLKNAGAPVAYRVQANLDLGTLYPMLKVEEKGTFSPLPAAPAPAEDKPQGGNI